MEKSKEIGHELIDVLFHKSEEFKVLWNKMDIEIKDNIINEIGNLSMKLNNVISNISKNEIKDEIIAELKPVYNPMFEGIDFNTEGSLSETYYYMSLPNTMKILELCFEKTYNKTINRL